MKSKFALALELLEQEVEVLNKEQQSQFIGGSNGYYSNGYDSNSYLSNGNCTFNNITYIASQVPGGAATGMSTDAYDYKNAYYNAYGEDDYVYDDSGNLVGLSDASHLNSFVNSYFTTNQLGSAGQTGVNSALDTNGHMVSGVLKTGYYNQTPTGHDITILSHNGGTYTYYDTTLNGGHGGTATASYGDFIQGNMVEITGLTNPPTPIPTN